MKLINRGMCIATASLIAGCSTPLPYTPPTEGPVATLFLRSAPNSIPAGRGDAAIGQNTAYDTFADSTKCQGAISIADRMRSGDVKSVAIAAGRPIAFRYFFSQLVPIFTCGGVIEFIPEPGKIYSLGFEERPLLFRQCIPTLQHQVDTAGHYADTLFKKVCIAPN